jgi:hypothetical protein
MFKCMSSMDVTAVVAVFSAVWFVLGVLLGRRLPPSPPRRPRQTSGRNQTEGSGAAGVVELYVGNLSYDATEKEVQQAFGAYGKVVSVRIITHRMSGKSKGFGFVEMANKSDAAAAVRALNGKEVKGRKLVVNEAKSEPRDR